MTLVTTTDDYLLAPPPEVVLRSFMATIPSEDDFQKAENELLKLPQVDIPLTHRFSDGVYVREMLAPVGAFIIGAHHKEGAINILLSGKAVVMRNGAIEEMRAPQVFKAAEGRKVAYVTEEMRWLTIHPNPDNERDIRALENRIAEFSEAVKNHRQHLLGSRGCIYSETIETP